MNTYGSQNPIWKQVQWYSLHLHINKRGAGGSILEGAGSPRLPRGSHVRPPPGELGPSGLCVRQWHSPASGSPASLPPPSSLAFRGRSQCSHHPASLQRPSECPPHVLGLSCSPSPWKAGPTRQLGMVLTPEHPPSGEGRGDAGWEELNPKLLLAKGQSCPALSCVVPVICFGCTLLRSPCGDLALPSPLAPPRG